MRRLLPALLFAGLLLLPIAAQAQLKAGVGLVYGFDVEQPGLQINAYYGQGAEAIGLGSRFEIGGDFTYYFVEDVSTEDIDVTSRFYTLNPNVHFKVYQDDVGEIVGYVLGGLNLGFASVSIDGVDADDDSDVNLGINVGGGVNYSIGPGFFFGEAKYVFGINADAAEQLVIAAGIRIPLGG